MRTLGQNLKNQKNAIVFWWILLIVSILLVFTPALADKVISFEASMAGAFVGVVLTVISIVMLRIFYKRKGLVSSLADKSSIIDIWECPDRYDENKGGNITAYFSKKGIFYAGNPYCLRSYECVIQKAEVIDDEGPALSVIYTVPSSRNGAFRHKSTVSIPVPEEKTESAHSLADYYTQAGSKAK